MPENYGIGEILTKRISTIMLFDIPVADIAWPRLGACVRTIYEAVVPPVPATH
jgi:hypothetical protein